MSFNLYLSRPFTAGVNTVEQVTAIKPIKVTPYVHYPVICLPIGDVMAGDIIHVADCSCQVSWRETTFDIMVASLVIVTDRPITDPVSDRSLWGPYLEVAEGRGTNISSKIHHHPVARSGQFTMPVDMANAHIVFQVYAASSIYDDVALLTVDQDYGRLEGAVLRKATAADIQALLNSVAPAPAPATAAVSIVLTQDQVDAVVAAQQAQQAQSAA